MRGSGVGLSMGLSLAMGRMVLEGARLVLAARLPPAATYEGHRPLRVAPLRSALRSCA